MKVINKFAFRVSGMVVAVVAAAMLIGVAMAQPQTNGDFETGDLSGWKVFNNAPTGSPGSWFVYSGTTPPLTPPAFGFKIPAPPQETFAAITD